MPRVRTQPASELRISPSAESIRWKMGEFPHKYGCGDWLIFSWMGGIYCPGANAFFFTFFCVMINIPLAERAVYRGWMRRKSSWLNMPICSAGGAHNFSRARRQNRARDFRFHHTHVCLRGACDILQLVQIASRHRRLTSYSRTTSGVSLRVVFLINMAMEIGLRLCASSIHQLNSAPLHLISYFIRAFWGSNASRARSDSLAR